MSFPVSPQRYDASLDKPEKDEAETAHSISRTLTEISEKTFADGRHALRSVHAKSHGLLKARLDVAANLPPQLAQGVFAKQANYPVVMRFSTIPGDLLDDSVSTPRGLAIKLIGVDGERLEGAEGATTQDFVMVNGPQFAAPNGKVFLGNLKLLKPTTDRIEGTKKVLSTVLRNVEKLLEAFGGESGLAKSLGGEPPTNILGETFFTQLPVRFGDYIAKIQLAPVSDDLVALKGASVDLKNPNTLREHVIEHFRSHTSVWELRVQLCSNIEDMPIGDPKKVWDEKVSPFFKVATITAEPQAGWSEKLSVAIDDGIGFSPWHGIQDHRPLGSLMRVRKIAYQQSQKFRSQRNPIPVREPGSIEEIFAPSISVR